MAKGKHLFFYKDRIFALGDYVYSPERYGIFFEENFTLGVRESALDLCTGSGFFPILMAEKAERVIGIDINPFNVNAAKTNVLLNGVDNVEIRQGDLFEAVSPSEKFDLIVAWPPEFPTPPEKQRKDWSGIATEAGIDGRKIIDHVILNASKFLNQNGRLQILHAWYANIPKSLAMLNELGFDARITAEQYFSVGQISYERADHLKNIGFPLIERDDELVQYHAVVTAWWRQET